MQFLFKGDVNTPSTTVSTLDGVKLLASSCVQSLVASRSTPLPLNVAPGILTERDGINFNICSPVSTGTAKHQTAAILLSAAELLGLQAALDRDRPLPSQSAQDRTPPSTLLLSISRMGPTAWPPRASSTAPR